VQNGYESRASPAYFNRNLKYYIFLFKLLVATNNKENYMTLKEVRPGQTCTVCSVAKGNDSIRHRIFDMGVTSGVKITMVKVAPLGDPIEVVVRGYNLSLRKKEAELIDVEE
jgi:ferrous iron transport protein A